MIRATLRDSLIYGFASLLSKGLAIFLLPIYTRVLSVRDYGAYDLLLTLGALANLIVAMEVSQGLARHWVDLKSPTDRSRLASTALWFTVCMYFAFLIFGLSFSELLSDFLFSSQEFLPSLRFGLVFIAVNGVYYLFLNQFRWELRSGSYAVASLAYALGVLILSLLFCFVLDMGLEGVMLGQMLAALLASCFSWYLLRHSFGWFFDFSLLRKMLIFSAPLVPAGLATFVSLYMNRVALHHFSTLDELGLFGVASRLAGVMGIMMLGVQSALMPLVYQHYNEPTTPEKVAKLFGWFVALAWFVCLFLILGAKWILTLFATSEYSRAAGLVAYLAPALLLSQMYIFAPGIGIRKKTYIQLLLTMFAAGTSLLANQLLVPEWGGTGAAVATLLSALVFFVSWVCVSQRLYPIPYAWRAVGGLTVGFCVCAGLGLWLDTDVGSIWVSAAAKLMLVVFFLALVFLLGLVSAAELRSVRFWITQRFGRPG
ncbi:oligosaccharide flippase family protein [Curvibacter sp. RS43]|uniref:oligosaccharide flippase family protein n=1 Tax=Curvibacter microcysteis TaxID=3026419 RepID=UPI00236179EA|nr:oligosaccharide flippase family protein [Curvibacter sp. RS43]MDD0808782.1 oligosaccharide flippase family protein [Curvibacter sp. RS43]